MTHHTTEISLDSSENEIIQDGVFHPELHHFRENIESNQNSLKQQPYNAGKKKIIIYKCTFFSLGVVFSLLSLFIFLKNPNWTYSHFFLSDIGIGFKSMINFVCFVFASLSFFLTFHRRIEIEIAYQIYNTARGRIKNIKRRKEMHRDWKEYLGRSYLETIPLKHAYQDMIHQIDNRKTDLILLLKQVAQCTTTDRDKKEILFNQALIEFKLSLDNTILSFSSGNLCDFTSNSF